MPITPAQALANGSKGGRPKGVLNPETKLKIKVTKSINRKIMRMADKLIQSQAISAIGTHKVIVMTKTNGIMSVETVRDIKRIDDLIENGEYGKDYLIVAGAEPDWKAANALLDRAFGKAKESLQVEGEIGFSLKVLAERREQIEGGEAVKEAEIIEE